MTAGTPLAFSITPQPPQPSHTDGDVDTTPAKVGSDCPAVERDPKRLDSSRHGILLAVGYPDFTAQSPGLDRLRCIEDVGSFVESF